MQNAFDQNQGTNELHRIREVMDKAVEYLKGEYSSLLVVRAFTDNFLIALPISGKPETGSISILIDYVAGFQTEMARCGYFIRGAITIGEIYIDDELVYGPALLEVVEAEKDIAVFPRVVLTDAARNLIKQEHRMWDPKYMSGLLLDQDGTVFVDYLDQTVLIGRPVDGPFTEILENHREAIIDQIKACTRPRVRSKLEWLVNYHNSSCLRYPDLDLPQFAIEGQKATGMAEPWRIDG